MPQVSANNLQTSLSVHSSRYTSALVHYSIDITHYKTNRSTTKATSTQGPCLRGIAQGQESMY